MAADEIPAVECALFQQVMRKLKITWDDDEPTHRVRDELIPNAEAALRDRLGIPDSAGFSFLVPGAENILLENHCWYAYYDALEEFYEAYFDLIEECRRKWEVIQYALEKEAEGADAC